MKVRKFYLPLRVNHTYTVVLPEAKTTTLCQNVLKNMSLIILRHNVGLIFNIIVDLTCILIAGDHRRVFRDGGQIFEDVLCVFLLLNLY